MTERLAAIGRRVADAVGIPRMSDMQRNPEILGAPRENFSRGLLGVELHQDFGKKIEGKVRDNWVLAMGHRIMITTDRQSAFDRMICTVPGKGKVLNLSSAFWFASTRDIIQNHMIAVVHPNVLIAEQAADTLPVEMVVRGYMAKSSTSTSVYHNYAELGRRNIYGIDFPEGLRANERFERPIVTPTTKAEEGSHDKELTGEEARDIVDSKFGKGTYSKAEAAALELFKRGAEIHKANGLLLVDTKYEFGLSKFGGLMLIDEIHTPDSSRIWLDETYQRRFEKGENPNTFDKEVLRRWLAEKKNFRGEGRVPVVDPEIIESMREGYVTPYTSITRNKVPGVEPYVRSRDDSSKLEREIQQAVNRFYVGK